MPLKLQDEFQCGKHPHENPICRGMMQKSTRRSVTAPLCCLLMEGANLVLSRAPLLEPVVRLVGWRGSNYRPGRSWCRCACHSDPCRVRNVRMVCVRLPAVKFKRRVQATVWAGAFVRFAAFEVAGRLLGVLGHAGAVATPAIDTLKTQRLYCLFDAE